MVSACCRRLRLLGGGSDPSSWPNRPLWRAEWQPHGTNPNELPTRLGLGYADSIEDRGYPILPSALVNFTPFPHFQTDKVNRMPIRHNRVEGHFKRGYLIASRISDTNKAFEILEGHVAKSLTTQRAFNTERPLVYESYELAELCEYVVSQFVKDIIDTLLDRIGKPPYSPDDFPEVRNMDATSIAGQKQELRELVAKRLTPEELSGSRGLTAEMIKRLTKSDVHIALPKAPTSRQGARNGQKGLSQYYCDGKWHTRLRAFFGREDYLDRSWGRHANRYRRLMRQIEHYIGSHYQPDARQAISNHYHVLRQVAALVLWTLPACEKTKFIRTYQASKHHETSTRKAITQTHLFQRTCWILLVVIPVDDHQLMKDSRALSTYGGADPRLREVRA